MFKNKGLHVARSTFLVSGAPSLYIKVMHTTFINLLDARRHQFSPGVHFMGRTSGHMNQPKNNTQSGIH
jgi:hypothetical protein